MKGSIPISDIGDFYISKIEVPYLAKIESKYLPDNIGGLPEVTSDDDGKVLRVVDGAWAATELPNGEEMTF